MLLLEVISHNNKKLYISESDGAKEVGSRLIEVESFFACQIVFKTDFAECTFKLAKQFSSQDPVGGLSFLLAKRTSSWNSDRGRCFLHVKRILSWNSDRGRCFMIGNGSQAGI